MSKAREWLGDLAQEVRLKNERVKRLQEGGEKAVDELRAAVEKDVEYINREIYLHDDALEVVADSALGFRVTNANTNEMSLVQLRPKDEILYLDAPHARPLSFSAESGNAGVVNFTDGHRLLSAEEISRMVLEPLVTSEFGLED